MKCLSLLSSLVRRSSPCISRRLWLQGVHLVKWVSLTVRMLIFNSQHSAHLAVITLCVVNSCPFANWIFCQTPMNPFTDACHLIKRTHWLAGRYKSIRKSQIQVQVLCVRRPECIGYEEIWAFHLTFCRHRFSSLPPDTHPLHAQTLASQLVICKIFQ